MDDAYTPAFARIVTVQESASIGQWASERFSATVPSPPFSFIYGGQSSAELLKTWDAKYKMIERKVDRTESTLTFTDPASGLMVESAIIVYANYPAVEWVIHFRNIGEWDTPLLENVQALDIALTRSAGSEYILHHARGSNSKIEDFQPSDDTLPPGSNLTIHSFGVHPWGMSSVESLPFFNVESEGRGMLAAVGWSGPWSARFARDEAEGLRVKAGMDTTHLVLHPGEVIRTPRMLVLFWEGNLARSHNLWRRLLLEHYSPKPGGKLLKVPLCDANWGELGAKEQIGKIKWWKEHDLPMECYWIDAGWNGNKGEDCFTAAANRVPRSDLYPDGLSPVSDAAHKQGMQFLLWTWPHIIRQGMEIGLEHPEWEVPGNGLDHGNPEVNRWMIDKYTKSVDEFGLDIFRQDGHSIYPEDTGCDRTGISQIRYTEGFYEFWDALLASHPGLIIDNCAGGGRKLDIETIRRSIPLWRSDYQSGTTGMGGFDPIGIQCQTWSLSKWIPLSAAATEIRTAYGMRSSYSPGLTLTWHGFHSTIDDGQYDFAFCRKMLLEFLTLRKFFYGDYYPLTPYSLAADTWMAWQFDRPDLGAGMLQAFRRPECSGTSITCKLFGLDSEAVYTVINLDDPGVLHQSGKELMEKGISVLLVDRPGAAVITYTKEA